MKIVDVHVHTAKIKKKLVRQADENDLGETDQASKMSDETHFVRQAR